MMVKRKIIIEVEGEDIVIPLGGIFNSVHYKTITSISITDEYIKLKK